jgi:hypothetical protein
MPEQPSQYPNERPNPKTVLAVKPVEVVLVRYTDDAGTEITQLAVVGEKNVHMLDGKATGFSRANTPQGVANDWLKNGIFAKLGRK